MRYYLSSYELGTAAEEFLKLVPKGAIAYVPNARDFAEKDSARYSECTRKDIAALENLGLEVRLLDLEAYFGRPAALAGIVEQTGAVFLSGGNCFVLRQAMRLSGLDTILDGLRSAESFLYSGYSAAGCVLSAGLKGYEIVDPVLTPYPQAPEAIWEGLGHIPFHFLPHWRSAHPESADVEKVKAYCDRHGIDCRLLRDGEALLAAHEAPLELAGSATGGG